MLMYPGFFVQDLVGPYTVLSMLADTRVHLVAARPAPVAATPGALAIVPTTTLDGAPRDLDVLLVPGGAQSTLAALQDAAALAFIAERGARARYVTSVCTGSLLLGAAGLLRGYRAASHWMVRELLRELRALPCADRVVVDRNRITGAGVTAGIDFALILAAELEGRSAAEGIQLALEYAPSPPFSSGSPESAPPSVRAEVERRYGAFLAQAPAAVASAVRRLRVSR